MMLNEQVWRGVCGRLRLEVRGGGGGGGVRRG